MNSNSQLFYSALHVSRQCSLRLLTSSVDITSCWCSKTQRNKPLKKLVFSPEILISEIQADIIKKISVTAIYLASLTAALEMQQGLTHGHRTPLRTEDCVLKVKSRSCYLSCRQRSSISATVDPVSFTGITFLWKYFTWRKNCRKSLAMSNCHLMLPCSPTDKTSVFAIQ